MCFSMFHLKWFYAYAWTYFLYESDCKKLLSCEILIFLITQQHSVTWHGVPYVTNRKFCIGHSRPEYQTTRKRRAVENTVDIRTRLDFKVPRFDSDETNLQFYLCLYSVQAERRAKWGQKDTWMRIEALE